MSDACVIPIKMAEAEIRAILLALDAELVNPNYGLTSSILPLREMDGLPGL